MNTLSELARHVRRAYGFATATPRNAPACCRLTTTGDVAAATCTRAAQSSSVCHPNSSGDLLVRSRLPCSGNGRGSREKLEPGTFAYAAAGDRQGLAELLLELAEELRAEIRSATGRRFAHVRAPLESLAGARPSVLPTEGAAARGSEFGSP